MFLVAFGCFVSGISSTGVKTLLNEIPESPKTNRSGFRSRDVNYSRLQWVLSLSPTADPKSHKAHGEQERGV